MNYKDGRAFLYTLALPRSSIFPSRSAFLYDIVFAFPYHPMQLIACALCVYGRIRWAGSTRHCATTPLVTRTRCTILLARSRFGVKLVSRPQSPPSTSPLSIRHNSVISSQEREFSVPILSRSVFPRARVPKISGTQEHKTRNECPSLVTVHTLVSANLTSGGKRRKTV